MIAPSAGNYNIQSHFAGDSLYNATNSPEGILSVANSVVIVRGNTQTNTASNTANGGNAIQSVNQQNVINVITDAGVSQTAIGGSRVTLNGMASHSANVGGAIVAYEWTQLPTGVSVVLTGANTATPTFTVPSVPTNTVLAFSLRVMDNHGVVSNPAIVYVMVKHNPNNDSLYIGGNTPRTTLIQPQHQPLPNNLLPTPSQPNFHPSQIGSHYSAKLPLAGATFSPFE